MADKDLGDADGYGCPYDHDDWQLKVHGGLVEAFQLERMG